MSKLKLEALGNPLNEFGSGDWQFVSQEGREGRGTNEGDDLTFHELSNRSMNPKRSSL